MKTAEEGGWPVIPPSDVPFDDGDPPSLALDLAAIDAIVAAIEVAAKRALATGFELIEIHAAHGYLLHAFLPVSATAAPTNMAQSRKSDAIASACRRATARNHA